MSISEIKVAVGIPWRSHPDRMTAFRETYDFYIREGYEVFTHDHAPRRDATALIQSPFNVAATRNDLVRSLTRPLNGQANERVARAQTAFDIVVLSDADTTAETAVLREAIEAAYSDNLVHLPYHVYQGMYGKLIDGATSGVYVTTRRAWAKTNGQDESFEGWGYEDSAWRLAHLLLAGPIHQHVGTALARFHPEADRSKVAVNSMRFRQYRDAFNNNDQGTMKMLTALDQGRENW